MPELLGITDRIYVMNEGRFVAEMPTPEASQEKIMRAIMQSRHAGMNMEPPPRSSPAARPKTARWLPETNLREYGMLLSLVAIMVFFQVMTDGTLMQPLNLTNLVLQNSYIVIMALGMLLVIVAGHIDLSVGSVCGFVGALAAVLMVQHGWHPLPATLRLPGRGRRPDRRRAGLVRGLLPHPVVHRHAGRHAGVQGPGAGAAQGPVGRPLPRRLPAAELGLRARLLFGGGGLRLTSLLLGAGGHAGAGGVGLAQRANQQRHGHGGRAGGAVQRPAAGVSAILLMLLLTLMASYKGLPNVLIVMFALILAFDFITTRTVVGRRVYALGGNEKAARLSGIRTERLAFGTFVGMGALAALAGLVFAARLNTATPKAGLGFELDVIAACFIGGASASGGVGKVMGAVIGAFIMGVMNNGMSILGIGIDYQQVIKGLVLLGAVAFDVVNRNK
jgi:putative multiple sugar transport system permease protein